MTFERLVGRPSRSPALGWGRPGRLPRTVPVAHPLPVACPSARPNRLVGKPIASRPPPGQRLDFPLSLPLGCQPGRPPSRFVACLFGGGPITHLPRRLLVCRIGSLPAARLPRSAAGQRKISRLPATDTNLPVLSSADRSPVCPGFIFHLPGRRIAGLPAGQSAAKSRLPASRFPDCPVACQAAWSLAYSSAWSAVRSSAWSAGRPVFLWCELS